MSSSQPLANIAGSPVISAPNTLATQVPAATGAQPWSRFLTRVCVSMATSCLARAAAAEGHSSPYVEDNKDLKLLFTFSYILTPGLDRNVLLQLSGLLELIWVCWWCHCLEILLICRKEWIIKFILYVPNIQSCLKLFDGDPAVIHCEPFHTFTRDKRRRARRGTQDDVQELLVCPCRCSNSSIGLE